MIYLLLTCFIFIAAAVGHHYGCREAKRLKEEVLELKAEVLNHGQFLLKEGKQRLADNNNLMHHGHMVMMRATLVAYKLNLTGKERDQIIQDVTEAWCAVASKGRITQAQFDEWLADVSKFAVD